MKRSGDTGDRDRSDLGYVSLETAIAWIDAATRCLSTERVSLCNARGRVLSEDSRAGSAFPPCDRAALDGFAVRAQESVGADTLLIGVDERSAAVWVDGAWSAVGPGRVVLVRGDKRRVFPALAPVEGLPRPDAG